MTWKGKHIYRSKAAVWREILTVKVVQQINKRRGAGLGSACGLNSTAVCLRLEISDSSLPDDPVRNTTLSRVLRLQLESQTQFVASSVDVLSIDQGRKRQLHSWTHTVYTHQTQAMHGSNSCLTHISHQN